MKTLGLIGGISWHSTAVYYQLINQFINEQLGGNSSAQLLLYSVNYNNFKQLQAKGDWKGVETMLSTIATKLENAGADCVIICSNTPHLIAESVKEKINIPLLHIAEETAKYIAKQNTKKVGLLGTKFTMENSFFMKALHAMGIETIIPAEEERELIHTSILNELSKGICSAATKKTYLKIMEQLNRQGAEGIILGCTEIGMFINQSDCQIKLFDTTHIHAKAAVHFALFRE